MRTTSSGRMIKLGGTIECNRFAARMFNGNVCNLLAHACRNNNRPYFPPHTPLFVCGIANYPRRLDTTRVKSSSA